MCVACYVDEAAKEVVTLLFLKLEVSEPHNVILGTLLRG